MVCCSVFGCKNNHRVKELTFFRFPKNEKLMNQWIWACRRQDTLNMNTARICSIHFKETDHYKSLKYEMLGLKYPKCCRKLKVDAVPSLHLPKQKDENIDRTEERLKRIEKRDRQKLVKEILSASVSRTQASDNSPERDTPNTCLENLLFTVDNENDECEKFNDNVVEVNIANESSSDVQLADDHFILTNSKPQNEQMPVSDDAAQNHEIIFITYDETDENAQSSKDQLIRALLNENKELKSEVAGLKRYLKQMNTERKDHIKEILKPLFTEGQIRCLLQDFKKRIQWSPDDIAYAIALRSVSHNAYEYLRNTLNFPLPAVSTLRRCASKPMDGCTTEEIMQTMEEKINNTDEITEIDFYKS